MNNGSYFNISLSISPRDMEYYFKVWCYEVLSREDCSLIGWLLGFTQISYVHKDRFVPWELVLGAQGRATCTALKGIKKRSNVVGTVRPPHGVILGSSRWKLPFFRAYTLCINLFSFFISKLFFWDIICNDYSQYFLVGMENTLFGHYAVVGILPTSRNTMVASLCSYHWLLPQD